MHHKLKRLDKKFINYIYFLSRPVSCQLLTDPLRVLRYIRVNGGNI